MCELLLHIAFIAIMALPKLAHIPPGLGFGNRYYLRLRKRLKKSAIPQRPRGEFFLSEYNIQRRNAATNPKRWGKVRKLRVESNFNGYRWDMCIKLSHKSQNRTVAYSRILALTFHSTAFGIKGRKLKRLLRVTTKKFAKFYDADHIHWNNLDCRLKALRILPITRHRGSHRLGWQRKSLTHHQKCVKIRAIWDRAVASGRVFLRPRPE